MEMNEKFYAEDAMQGWQADKKLLIFIWEEFVQFLNDGIRKSLF